MAPTVAQKSPYEVQLVAGKKYFWCACGLSKKQPFCDGAHKGTEFNPQVITATENGTAFLCGCKHTKSQPFCDGSHSGL